ncbi:MAG: hypothetical protein K5767_07575 [Clostridia bacterium]|nr:hypothetical protein [Clostridia bacterium]
MWSIRKKLPLLLTLSAALALTAAPVQSCAASKVTATVPTYKCELEYNDVDNKTSKYPLLNYKGVTYFPMTWGYCRTLGLTSVWIQGEGLFIASWGTYAVGEYDYEFPVYAGSRNPGKVTATVADYPIFVNGKQLDNSKEEYPILNFRDVTYFPMTWRFAREEFDWDTDWSQQENRFSVHWQIEDDTSYDLDVYEVTDTEAYLVRDVSKSVVIGEHDGSDVYSTKAWVEFCKLDFATGTLTESEERGSYESYRVGDTNYLPVGRLDDDISLITDITYTDEQIPAPYTPFTSRGYARIGDTDYLMDEGVITEDAIRAGEYVFVNARRYTGWKGFVCGNYELYRLNTATGVVDRMDTNYKDYASMKLLGTDAGGRLYVKCQQGVGEMGMEGGLMNASAYNDGYYIMDPDTGALTLLRRFVYTDGDILTPDGHIYGIFDWKNSVEKLY